MDAQTSQITCMIQLHYVSAFTRSAKAHVVDVRTHQKRRHIFKTAFPTFYMPQYAAQAGRICRKGLYQVPPFDPWRSGISVQVTTHLDIRVGCAYILLRRLGTIREEAFLGHRQHVYLRGSFGCASRTCLEPSWVLRVIGDRCRRLRSRREAVGMSLVKF